MNPNPWIKISERMPDELERMTCDIVWWWASQKRAVMGFTKEYCGQEVVFIGDDTSAEHEPLTRFTHWAIVKGPEEEWPK